MTTLHRVSALLLPVGVLLAAAPARAQEVTRLPDGAVQSLGLDAGLDASFVARATYVRRLPIARLLDARLYARATLPFIEPDLGDWGIDIGMQASLVAWRGLRLALALGPLVRSSDQRLFTALAFGLGATLLAGYEGARWGLSAELGYEQVLATWLRQSDLYRDTHYGGARDGLYSATGSSARAGLRGGVRLGPVEIAARGGLDWTGRFTGRLVPFFATLGAAYAF